MRGIAEHPVEVLDRSVAGHWEGDLLVGRYGRSHLVTLVERHSRYLLVLPVPDATTVTVVSAVARAFLELPDAMRGSLTWDRGVEMTSHADLTEATGMKVYFCDAYSPWQRGSNENTNGLLRQYFRKKTTPLLDQPAAAATDPRPTQPTATSSPRMEDSSRGLLVRGCCDDRLKPRSTRGRFSADGDDTVCPDNDMKMHEVDTPVMFA